ncbi:MAG: hypothetical protein U1F54_10185 [Burkholderiales bacterium]
MTKPSIRAARAAVAALATIAAAYPAFAAWPALWPVPVPFSSGSMTQNDWILTGSLVLLAVGLAVWLMRRSRREPVAEGPDLRWWRNP